MNADGTITRVEKERIITIGGGGGGPPSMLDLLSARKKLRPVPTRDGGWDKSNASIGILYLVSSLHFLTWKGMDFGRRDTRSAANRPNFDVPIEAIELYLKLKRRYVNCLV